MNISSLGNIPNITNQITTGAPQAGLRCDPSAAVRSAGKGATRGMDISGLGTLKTIDEPPGRATGRTSLSGTRRRACGGRKRRPSI